MNNLANLYQETGRYAEAESLQTAAPGGAAGAWPAKRIPATLFAMNNLANTLSSQGDLPQAPGPDGATRWH